MLEKVNKFSKLVLLLSILLVDTFMLDSMGSMPRATMGVYEKAKEARTLFTRRPVVARMGYQSIWIESI